MEKITVGIVNFNGMEALPATLEALRGLSHPVHGIMVVDNHSTDGSREWLQQQHPEVNCIALTENLGSAGARNILLERADTDWVFLMDNDISVAPDVLERLLEAMAAVPTAGLAHPEILDENDPHAYHYNGGRIHYLGALVDTGPPPPDGQRARLEIHDVVSGAAMLVRKSRVLAIGGFDEAYFFNWEDGDFTARLSLAGHPCLNVPGARVHHRSKPRGTSKVFYQVRNRWYFLLKLYDWKTLLCIAPMLCVFEALQAAFLLKKGAFRDYWRANRAVLRDLPAILVRRRDFQKIKRRRDRDWLHGGRMFVPAQLKEKQGVMDMVQRIVYGCFDAYWFVARKLC